MPPFRKAFLGLFLLLTLITGFAFFTLPSGAVGGTDLFLDPSFGGQGMALPTINRMGEIRDLLELSDGSFLAVAPVDEQSSSYPDFAVIKLRADGSLDTTFGTNGVSSVNVSPSSFSEDSASSLLVDSQGRIVLVGTYLEEGNNYKIGMVRFFPNGSLDTTFATGGIGRSGVASDGAYVAVALQSDGKIVVANGQVIARFLPNGATLDPTFSKNGTILDYGSYYRDILIEPNGAIVVGGAYGDSFRSGLSLLRLLSNGTPDITFGVLGRSIISAPNSTQSARGETLLPLPNGGYLLSGSLYNSTSNPSVAGILAQVNATGDLDPTFGSDGIVTLDRIEGYENFAGAARYYDGRITVGSAKIDYNERSYLAQFLPNGTLNPAFGENGIVEFTFEDFRPHHGILIDGNGRAVVGGEFARGAVRRFQPNGAIDHTFGYRGYTLFGASRPIRQGKTIRLQQGDWFTFSGAILTRTSINGSPDLNFGSGGWDTIPFPPNSTYSTHAALLDYQWRPVVLNHVQNFNPPHYWMLSRHTNTGTLDPSFGTNGVVSETLTVGYNAPTVLLETDNAKYVMGGRFPDYPNNQTFVWLFRYLENGQRDPTFDGDGKVELSGCGDTPYPTLGGVLQTDGNVVVGGNCGNNGGRVWRVSINGSLDTTFGTGGSIAVTRPRFVRTLAQDNAGRTYVMGSTTQSGQHNAEILRLLPNGSPDPAWGAAGIASFPLPDTFIFPIYFLQDSTGRFYVIGHVEYVTEPSDLFVARLLSNGIPDPAFGVNGQTTMLLTDYDIPTDVDWDDDALRITASTHLGTHTGNSPILAWFRYLIANSTPPTPTVTPFPPTVTPSAALVLPTATRTPTATTLPPTATITPTPNGTVELTLDSAYGGAVMAPLLPQRDALAYDALLLPDEKILATTARFYGNANFMLTRLLSNGDVDLTYGTNGVLEFDYQGETDIPRRLLRFPDGSLIIGGDTFIQPNNQQNLLFTRLLPNGNQDTTFGDNGWFTTHFGLSYVYNYISDLVRDPVTGSWYVVASAAYQDNQNGYVIARFLADGTPDPTFGGGDGVITAGIRTYQSLIVLADGKLMATGSTNPAPSKGGDLLLSRFLSDGSPDSTFGTNGDIVVTGLDGAQEGYHLLIDAAGRFVVTGYSFNITPYFNGKILVARFFANGAPDTTFDEDGIKIFTNPTPFHINQRGWYSIPFANGSLLITTDNGDATRLNADGTSDTTFGVDGWFPWGQHFGIGGIRRVLAESTGRFYFVTDGILRVSANGLPDHSYGARGYLALGRFLPTAAYSSLVEATPNAITATPTATPNTFTNGMGAFAATAAPDGSLLAMDEYGIYRFSREGRFDLNFDRDGYRAFALEEPFATPAAIAADTTGRVLTASTYSNTLEISRMLPNGTLDSTFGVGGVSTTTFYSEAIGLRIQLHPLMDGRTLATLRLDKETPNGEILIADLIAIRLNSNGTLDTTYGENGIAKFAGCPTDYNGRWDLNSTLDSQGRLVLASRCNLVSTGIILLRWDANGLLDPTFGNNGFYYSDSLYYITQLTTDAQDRIYIASNEILSRFLSNGQPDLAFGTNGRVTLASPITTTANAVSISHLPEGRTLVTVSANDTNNRPFSWLVRLNPNGSLDSAFGINGYAEIDLFGGRNLVALAHLTTEHHLLTLGWHTSVSTLEYGPSQFVAARWLLNDLPPLPTATPTVTPSPTATGVPITPTATRTPSPTITLTSTIVPSTITPSPTRTPTPTATRTVAPPKLYLPLVQR